MRGHAAYRTWLEKTWQMLPDLHMEPDGPVLAAEDGTRAAAPWRLRGTMAGPLDPPGFAPTHKPIELTGIDVWRFRDGHGCQLRVYETPPGPSQPSISDNDNDDSPGPWREIVKGCPCSRAGLACCAGAEDLRVLLCTLPSLYRGLALTGSGVRPALTGSVQRAAEVRPGAGRQCQRTVTGVQWRPPSLVSHSCCR
jgi:hypothetical protein